MEHLDLLVPTPGTALAVAPFGVGYAMLVGAIASRLRLRRAVRAPYTRKLFHFGIFTMAAVVQWIGGPAGVIVFGTAVAAVVLHATSRGDGHPLYEALARPSDAPR